MKILVTGGAGFIGKALIDRLIRMDNYQPLASVRRITNLLPPLIQIIHDVGPDTDWREALHGADAVVHNAALVHVSNDGSDKALQAYRNLNTHGTLNLARQAAMLGVKRFIYISSIKVNGECTKLGKPFLPDDKPKPVGPYSISKYEAEVGLFEMSAITDMDVVIIRPPLVYGPGVKSNFLTMMQWLIRGIPLPLASIDNKRSLVAIDNLIDLIITCIEHPAAANQTFLVSDGEDLSTTELLRRLGSALGKPAILLPVPQNFVEMSMRVLGKGELVERLCGSLQVDMRSTQAILGWSPPMTIDLGLENTAQAYLRSRQQNIL